MYKSPLRFHKYAWIMKDRSVYEERQSEPRKDVIGIIGADFITHNIPYIIRFRNHPLLFSNHHSGLLAQALKLRAC